MTDQPIILEGPIQIEFARLAALKGGLKLEIKGLRRSHPPSCYMILKRDYGYTGSRQSVLNQVTADVERLIRDRQGQAE